MTILLNAETLQRELQHNNPNRYIAILPVLVEDTDEAGCTQMVKARFFGYGPTKQKAYDEVMASFRRTKKFQPCTVMRGKAHIKLYSGSIMDV